MLHYFSNTYLDHMVAPVDRRADKHQHDSDESKHVPKDAPQQNNDVAAVEDNNITHQHATQHYMHNASSRDFMQQHIAMSPTAFSEAFTNHQLYTMPYHAMHHVARHEAANLNTSQSFARRGETINVVA